MESENKGTELINEEWMFSLHQPSLPSAIIGHNKGQTSSPDLGVGWSGLVGTGAGIAFDESIEIPSAVQQAPFLPAPHPNHHELQWVESH
ncbi:hypothetical protein Pmani_013848 [Petrolisthes manimaculis]|uniref:Uncharacterized protein n=1 Tax=Petrolisthes manimaculis TaxID=1843537 RepID=A0AAE1PV57_9EUCA|nr:hypothetical protein Pmani_013848 [Petrolisthes manimaculis]